MSLTIGQTIKKLRKEHNLTQEELAEQLNVTFQAVSKWENGTGLPDISQVVPIASVFGISTDVLFGTFGTTDNEEVLKIIEDAYKLNSNKHEKTKEVWDRLQDGLRYYPNNIWLLTASLECGTSLAYPDNGPDYYDEIYGEEIYKECIRQANLIISYSKNGTDILRARMIMIMLHSAHGNNEKAREHLTSFPERADFTMHNMSAYIAHAEKNYVDEAYHFKRDLNYHLTSMFDDIILLGKAYRLMGKHDDALKMFFIIFSFMEIIYKDEEAIPPIPNTDSGDAYVEIARTYLEMNDNTKALEWIEKMVDYYINILPRFKTNNDWDINIKQRLLNKLKTTEFDIIKNNERFIFLMNRVNALNDKI